MQFKLCENLNYFEFLNFQKKKTSYLITLKSKDREHP